jgi:hypothetical protein
MIKNLAFFLIGFMLMLTSCIGDDIVADAVDPELRITMAADTIQRGSSYLFEASYFNEVGQEVSVDVMWASSDDRILSIDDFGLAKGLAGGSVDISVTYMNNGSLLMDQHTVVVGEETVINNLERTGIIATTSSYALKGSFVLSQSGEDLTLNIAADYEASTSLPGLYLYLTNNPNTTVGAREVGRVQVFFGAHAYTITNAEINDFSYLLYFCKPFNVKVGEGQIQ